MKQASKKSNPASVDHNAAMIEELRAYPDYANAYLALVALRQVIEARGGFPKLPRLARQSIYHTLSPNGNPTIKTFAQLAAVAGLQFTLSKSSH